MGHERKVTAEEGGGSALHRQQVVQSSAAAVEVEVAAAAPQAAGQLPDGHHDVQLAARRALDGLAVAEDGLDRDVLVLTEPAVTPATAKEPAAPSALHMRADEGTSVGTLTAKRRGGCVLPWHAMCVSCPECTLWRSFGQGTSMLPIETHITEHTVIHY